MLDIGFCENEKVSITLTLDEWNSIIRNLQNVNPDLADVLIAADLEVIPNVPDRGYYFRFRNYPTLATIER